jgi:hypothetical protein
MSEEKMAHKAVEKRYPSAFIACIITDTSLLEGYSLCLFIIIYHKEHILMQTT